MLISLKKIFLNQNLQSHFEKKKIKHIAKLFEQETCQNKHYLCKI